MNKKAAKLNKAEAKIAGIPYRRLKRFWTRHMTSADRKEARWAYNVSIGKREKQNDNLGRDQNRVLQTPA